jgi:tetratricopeptide (TPR) repeat protein
MTRQFTVYLVAGVCLLSAAPLFAQPPGVTTLPAVVGQNPAAELLTQGQQKLREGKHDEALAIYRAAIEKAPPSSPTAVSAYVQAGVVLDLMGKYADARSQFGKAIEGAAALEDKARALRAMAMSYAFERDCDGATRYESQAYEGDLAAGDFFNAGEVANELARVCLESGSLNPAATWYQRGRDAGLKETGINPSAGTCGTSGGSTPRHAWPRGAASRPRRRSTWPRPGRSSTRGPTRSRRPSSRTSSGTWLSTAGTPRGR